MTRKLINILKEVLPIIVMICLIPIVLNDYILTVIYIFITLVSLFIKRERNDILIWMFGFIIIMIISESFFINTGVETFLRHSLLNIMPLWLPFLWAYGFIAIKRSINILSS